ncbi:hypothetical protein NA57DRAFT_52724 [Rhizodiscina lignyota]|uniref:Uncharacterized protein n=1 Tax=Rhizodiscina lignyota TaxID=1504668 RepID=A0A9P4MA00_9PEZI|nr:hypothetical protein NA57DRAFT_52724 [Rhizodiscina lignyota]
MASTHDSPPNSDTTGKRKRAYSVPDVEATIRDEIQAGVKKIREIFTTEIYELRTAVQANSTLIAGTQQAVSMKQHTIETNTTQLLNTNRRVLKAWEAIFRLQVKLLKANNTTQATNSERTVLQEQMQDEDPLSGPIAPDDIVHPDDASKRDLAPTAGAVSKVICALQLVVVVAAPFVGVRSTTCQGPFSVPPLAFN